MQQNEKKYKDQLDDFSKLIKQRLEDHRMPVDEDSWNAIEQRIKPVSNRRTMWWTIAVAAAAVILLVLLMLPLKEQDYITQIGTGATPDKIATSVEKNNIAVNGKDNVVKEENKIKITKKSSGSVRLISQQVSEAVSIDDSSSGTTKSVENSLLMIDTVQLAQIGNSLGVAEPDSESDLPEVNKDSVPSRVYKDVKKSNEPTRILIEKSKRQDKWLLAASFSSGGSASFGGGGPDKNGYYSMMNSLPSSESGALSDGGHNSYGKEFLDYNDFTNVSHSVPLSFGVTVRKDLTDRIGFETGLVYTYLSSKFRRSGTSYHTAKQELHYLGIPLNAVVYLWNNPNWNIYVSAGGMVEKGLRMNYSQSVIQREESNSLNYSTHQSIRGLQWSLNASVGVTYKFYSDWGIYFEPRYSYFFDNNQPFSIRSENSHVFGLSGGLRYSF